MFICLSAVTMKSFCRTFFKKFVGSRGKAPRGMFKGNALKLPKKIQNLRKQILTIITLISTTQSEIFCTDKPK